jgi:hypothetical protein
MVKLSVNRELPPPRPDRQPREAISELSRASARRLREDLATVKDEAFKGAVMTTLTYPVDDIGEQLADWHVYKRHLDSFTKALHRQYPAASGHWKLEPTKRGFPHYHGILYGIPDTEAELTAYRRWQDQTWFRIVGTGLEKHLQVGCHAERVRTVEGGRNYIAKYVSKNSGQFSGYTGRHWGRINAAAIPYAPKSETVLTPWQAVKVGRLLRKMVAADVADRRWKRQLLTYSKEHDSYGWTRVSMEYAGTLRGRDGDSVRLSSQEFTLPGKRKRIAISCPRWRVRMGAAQLPVFDGEGCQITSLPMAPTAFDPPKKYRLRNNESVTFFGNASVTAAALKRYLEQIEPRPDYVRPAPPPKESKLPTMEQRLDKAKWSAYRNAPPPQEWPYNPKQHYFPERPHWWDNWKTSIPDD